MAYYSSYDQLVGHTLSLWDEVVFQVGADYAAEHSYSYSYKVQRGYLSTAVDNSKIFNELGIEKNTYAATFYTVVGGKPATSWPEFSDSPSEYVKATNLVLDLFKKIEGRTSKTMSNIKDKFVLALTPEPKKSFRKAGVTNGDDLLTDDGQRIFLTWLLHSKYADEFKKEVVDSLLAEAEEAGK